MAQQSGTDRLYSREEYLLWCDAQPRGRFERVDGRIVAMAPERAVHVRVKTNVFMALRHAVREAGVGCEAWIDGLGVATGESDFEPDAIVNCGHIPDDDRFATNPVVVVEVLSPSTQSVDTSRKLLGYFEVPSIAHYLVVDSTHRRVIHHRRVGDAIATAIVVGGSISMDPPGILVEVGEFFAA